VKMSTAWFRFRSLSPANYFMAAAGLGIDYVEVPLYGNAEKWWGPVLPEDMKRLASTCGVTMVAGVAAVDLTAPFDMLGRPLTEDVAEFNRAFAMALIDKAAALGLEVVRIAEPNIGPKHQHLATQYVEDMGAALRPIADRAESYGIQVVVENYGFASDQMVALLDAADHDNLGTLFDPCNYVRMGEDALVALHKVLDRVYYCHLKDTLVDEQGKPEELFSGSRFRPSVAVGNGDIDWRPLLTTLAESYSGYASIEYEVVEDLLLGTKRSLDYVVSILQQADSA